MTSKRICAKTDINSSFILYILGTVIWITSTTCTTTEQPLNLDLTAFLNATGKLNKTAHEIHDMLQGFIFTPTNGAGITNTLTNITKSLTNVIAEVLAALDGILQTFSPSSEFTKFMGHIKKTLSGVLSLVNNIVNRLITNPSLTTIVAAIGDLTSALLNPPDSSTKSALQVVLCVIITCNNQNITLFPVQ